MVAPIDKEMKTNSKAKLETAFQDISIQKEEKEHYYESSEEEENQTIKKRDLVKNGRFAKLKKEVPTNIEDNQTSLGSLEIKDLTAKEQRETPKTVIEGSNFISIFFEASMGIINKSLFL